MATTRFKGETAGERLDYSSISDSDMLQLRHKPGTIEDEDKGISKSQLLSCPFGVSSTAAGTAAKTASLTDSNPDFILVSGREVVVCFTTANTASNPTLNFAGSGAIPIYYPNGSVVGAWDADTWMHLKYFYATVGNTSIQRWILMSPLPIDSIIRGEKNIPTSDAVFNSLQKNSCLIPVAYNQQRYAKITITTTNWGFATSDLYGIIMTYYNGLDFYINARNGRANPISSVNAPSAISYIQGIYIDINQDITLYIKYSGYRGFNIRFQGTLKELEVGEEAPAGITFNEIQYSAS